MIPLGFSKTRAALRGKPGKQGVLRVPKRAKVELRATTFFHHDVSPFQELTMRKAVAQGEMTNFSFRTLVLQQQEFDLPVFLLPGLRVGFTGHLVPPHVVLHQGRRPRQP